MGLSRGAWESCALQQWHLKAKGVSQAGLKQMNLYTYPGPQDPNHLVEGQAKMLQLRKGSTNIPVHGGSWQSPQDRWFSRPGNNLEERRKSVSRGSGSRRHIEWQETTLLSPNTAVS